MSDILVIGCGNPLRRDDGIGRVAIERLDALFVDGDVRFKSVHQLTPELAADAAEARFVIFIDARCDCEPGELRCESVDPSTSHPSSPHQYTPHSIVSIAAELYGAKPAAAIVSMGGADFEHGEGLSETVSARIDRLIDCVAALINFARG